MGEFKMVLVIDCYPFYLERIVGTCYDKSPSFTVPSTVARSNIKNCAAVVLENL